MWEEPLLHGLGTKVWTSHYILYILCLEYPSCLHATPASSVDQWSSQTVPHSSSLHTSTLPSLSTWPSTNLIPFSLQSTERQMKVVTCFCLITYTVLAIRTHSLLDKRQPPRCHDCKECCYHWSSSVGQPLIHCSQRSVPGYDHGQYHRRNLVGLQHLIVKVLQICDCFSHWANITGSVRCSFWSQRSNSYLRLALVTMHAQYCYCKVYWNWVASFSVLSTIQFLHTISD